MNAEGVVRALLEDGEEVAHFMRSLPKPLLASFHIVADGEGGIHASNDFRGYWLVYVNNSDGTRTFIGGINYRHEGLPKPIWVAVKTIRRMGRYSKSIDAFSGEPHASKIDAAKELYMAYLAANET